MNSLLAQNPLSTISQQIADALKVNLSRARVVHDLYRKPDISEAHPYWISIRVADMINQHTWDSNYPGINDTVDDDFDCCYKPYLRRTQAWEIEYWAINCDTCANPIDQVLAMAEDGIMRIYQSTDLAKVHADITSTTAPTREEGETPMAMLTQNWQMVWGQTPSKPNRIDSL